MTEHAANAHLRKAAEFLDAAMFCLDLKLYDAAASNAVSAAINASDALILHANEVPPRGQDHGRAATVLRRAVDADAARQLTRALGHKNRAQYDSVRTSPTQADEAVRVARRLVDKAKDRMND